jgi:hypothetical protein
VDPCTIAALDAIAAFAVPNPSSSSQSQPVFSGLVARSGRPAGQITQPTSDWQGLFRQSFQPSTEDKLAKGFALDIPASPIAFLE